MQKFLFSLFFICCFFSAFSQSGTKVEDKVLVNLTITDFEDKKIETTVKFEDRKTRLSEEFKTNEQGFVACRVATDKNYIISISGSDDTYDYNISDFPPPAITLTLKFNIDINQRASSKRNAVVAIKLYNNPGLKQLRILSGATFSGSTIISNDTAFIKLPANQRYAIELARTEIKGNIIMVDSSEYNLLYYVLYFRDPGHAELIQIKQDQAAIFIRYKDFYEKPAPGEKLVLKGLKTGTRYELTTASDGACLAIVPKNDLYSLSLKYFQDFATVDAMGEAEVMTANNVSIRYPSSAEYEKERKRMERAIIRRDSVYAMFEKIKELQYNGLEKKTDSTLSSIIPELKRDSLYFQKKNNIVCAVLYRNRINWRSRMIVTDVTGSMYPYMEQVTLWHLLEMLDKHSSEYVFFNDGDNKDDREKIIGKTGGVYSNLTGTSASIIKTMLLTMHMGGGGDSPENDIEALLKAQEIRSKTTELILVADALSAVKDISLLGSLHIPVRVILCGSASGVNIDYLEIAYKTGGSIHTIEQDIFDLSNLHEGDVLKIDGLNYRFTSGKFFPLTLKF